MLHRRVFILMLRALVLAGYDDAGGRVGDADGGVGGVDVLAASARGAEGVDAQVGGVDLNLDVVVDFGRDEDCGEGGVPAVARIEGRFAHQAVDAGLGAEPTISVGAADLDGGAFDAGDFAVVLIDQFEFKAAVFAPFQVHPQEHRRPVLGFGAAGAGLDVKIGVVAVFLAVEHAREFQIADAATGTAQALLQFV